MDSRHTTKAWIGIGIGLPLFVAGCAMLISYFRGHMDESLMVSTQTRTAFVILALSAPFYLWGCAQLAEAKGYSTAILATCLLGWLFPLVVLLVLPDKNKYKRFR
jgi:hypothetical protein